MSRKACAIVLAVAIIINIILFGIGLCNNDGFMEISLNGILSLDLTALVSVYFVQSLISQRRRYDFLVKVLDKVIMDLTDADLLNHDNNIRAALLQKSIANKLLYVSKACPNDFIADMNYIKNKFEEIQTYYGDHIDVKAEDPFYERVKTDIVDKTVKLQLELHGFIMK